MTTPINDPNTIYFWIARASTTEEWRRLNTRVHDELEKRLEELAPGVTGPGSFPKLTKEQERALDFDPKLCELNALGTMTQEILSMRTAAEKVLNPRQR
jgi:hypothetical protein